MKRLLLTCAIAQTIYGPLAQGGTDGFATWNAKSGGFSYSIINLSGTSCTLTAYGATPNISAPSTNPAYSLGWNGQPQDGSYPNDGWGFFQSLSYDVDNRVVFYNSDSPMQEIYGASGTTPTNPKTWSLSPSPSPYPLSNVTLSNGQNLSLIEPTIQMGSQPNPAAAGDSWTVRCGSGQTVVMANLASAGDSLGSGVTNGAYPYFVSNALINPQAPGNFGTFSSSNPPSGNVDGMGFVSSEDMVINLNQNSADANYQPTGGLWWGVENPNSAAVYSLVPAMFPVNLAAYTQAQQVNNNGNTQYQTYIYGGHLTFAIGDPFIVSSYAAKTLWFLATGSSFQLNDDSFDSDASTNAIQAFQSAISDGLFPANSYSLNYAQTLLNSTAQASFAINTAIKAASQANDHESFFGKLFAAMFNVTMTAIDVGAAVATGGESAAAQVAIQTAVNTATGTLGQPVDNAINNAFTTNTTMGPPATQTAPTVYNSSFAASNLLGLLLTNAFVQYQVNAFSGAGIGDNYANPLWSNYSIYTTNTIMASSATESNTPGSCSPSSLQVTTNWFGAGVQCYDASAGGYVNSSDTYTNVCETVNSSYTCKNSNTSESLLNIWDAILTGSDVGANDAGQLILQNPATWSFQPPTEISPSSSSGGPPAYSAVTTSFNLNTGYLTLTEAIGYTSPPSTQPTIESYTYPYLITSDCSSMTFSPTGVSYTSGMLTASGWSAVCNKPSGETWEGQAAAMLNVATCAEGSAVKFGVDVAPMTSQLSPVVSSVSLECVRSGETFQASAALNYNQCVSDPNATGGVVAMPLDTQDYTGPGLACVCIPNYIEGGTNTTTPYGYTSNGGSACPAPSASSSSAAAGALRGG